jgi:hypothetical protein
MKIRFNVVRFNLLVSIALFFGAPNAYASTAWFGTLSAVHFFNQGTILVWTNGSRDTPPACGSSQPGRFAVDANAAGGKAQLAGLLAAYTAGRNVIVVGTGTCNVYSDTETINYFYTVDP